MLTTVQSRHDKRDAMQFLSFETNAQRKQQFAFTQQSVILSSILRFRNTIARLLFLAIAPIRSNCDSVLTVSQISAR